MRKLLALYINEMIKISKKISVIIMLALMIVGVVAFGGLMKFQDAMNSKNSSNMNFQIQMQKENMNYNLESCKRRLDEIKKLKASATGTELQNLEAEERSNQNQIDMIEYAKAKDVILYSNGYRAQTIQKIFMFKDTINQLKALSETSLTEEQKKQLTEAESNVSTLQKILDNKDFKGYIDFSNNEIKSNTAMSDEMKKIYLESNELRLKHQLTGDTTGATGTSDDMSNYIYQIENAKRSLLDNVDYTGNPQNQKPLTPELRNKIKNDIAVIEYKIGKGISGNDMMGPNVKAIAMPGMLGIGTFMIVILVMILAGGSISQEMSSGSIKSLIISPTKRWKIFAAKVVSLLTVSIIASLVLYGVAVIANGIFFGFGSGNPYIFAVNGVAHELNFYVYQFARLFTGLIVVVIFMTFAFMLSIVTRNTAASVGISIAVYFVGSNANTILMQFVSGEWTKFIPFNNMDFTTKLFPNDSIAQGVSSINSVNNSITFSVCYITILIICMGYTALDSFSRRDIK